MSEHTKNKVEISPEQMAEIERFAREMTRLHNGEIDEDDFRRFRLENGIYGIRGSDDLQMIRVKIHWGGLNADQLDTCADIAEKYADPKVAHVTTRQNLQFHRIARKNVPAAMKMMAECGLTSREACGNTVRTVTACPFAGIASEEPFDVTPYADATAKYFLRNPLAQNMPRKFKIAFEGCKTDHARIGIHDAGVQAVVREVDGKAVRGFKIYVGGGLGAVPFPAVLLEEFTPADLLIPTLEAIIRLQDRHGNRKDKSQARLKFLIHKTWGLEEFQKQFEAERKQVIGMSPGHRLWHVEPTEQVPPPKPKLKESFALPGPGFEQWAKSNVVAQKQKGYKTVVIRCPLGDLSIEQMRGIAKVSREVCGGRIRASITQNLLLTWVSEETLVPLYQALVKLKIALPGGHELIDITRCPGSDTCNLAITRSRTLAEGITKLFTNGGRPLIENEALKKLTIKISGCPNSCGHHHIADLGFHGAARKIEGRVVPHYHILIGGGTTEQKASMGIRIGQVPAKRVPEVTQHLLELYRDGRQNTESMRDWVERITPAKLTESIKPFTTLPSYDEEPEMYGDLGVEGEFKLEIGQGECAA